jgi:hypothetical protein
MRPNKTTGRVVSERTLAIASLVGVAGLVLGLGGPADAANKTTKKVAKAAKAVAKPKAASSASVVKSVYPDAKPTLIFVWAPS